MSRQVVELAGDAAPLVGQLIPGLVQLYQQGRFPFDRLVKYYAMDQIEKALDDSKSGEPIKPILPMRPEPQRSVTLRA